MRYIENGIPEDFAKLCFAGMTVPLCELTEEEYMKVVFGIDNYQRKRRRGENYIFNTSQEEENSVLSESIEVLELSVRSSNGLRRAGIETVGQLVALTEWDVSKIRNMGVKSVKEVKAALSKLELSLKEAEQE